MLLFGTTFLAGFAQTCGGAGSISAGNSPLLDPNNDGFFTIYNGTGFTVGANEIVELEQLIGSGGADVDWTSLTGSEPTSDIANSGTCGNTDLVTDADGGGDYAYYTIVDPDGINDNGDEYLVFALRVAESANGAFGYSFLLDADNNCGTGDPDAVCGNPCFEYEIQLQTGNAGGYVRLYDIRGCAGTADCDAAATGGDADLCGGLPCNSGGIMVCAAGSECGNASDPVFWVFYINFSDIPSLISTDDFSLTPATTTSGNSVVYKGTNVSDYGGIDDINAAGASACDCNAACSGSNCADCLKDCLLACASENNNVTNPFPVTWLDLRAAGAPTGVALHWEVQEFGGVMGYRIERAAADENVFTVLDWVSAKDGWDGRPISYSYLDQGLSAGEYLYRLRMVEADGTEALSSIFSAHFDGAIQLSWLPAATAIRIDGLEDQGGQVRIFDMQGRLLQSETVTPGNTQVAVTTTQMSTGIFMVKYMGNDRREAVRIFQLR